MNAVANVNNKHILVTGAASGIGAETARVLASRGALVGVADLNEQASVALVEQIKKTGGNAYQINVDVRDSGSVKSMFSNAVNEGGDINILINNAGIDHSPAPMHLIPDEDYLKSISVNLTGVWLCMKQAIPRMLESGSGHIINVASVAGLRSAPTASAYSAAKHGVVGLTKSVAVEYAKANIRVNAVCPSFVDTPMVRGVLEQLSEKQKLGLVNANPMKRLGTCEEIANAIGWLCSDESSFMTGQSIVLDGGMMA